MLIDYVSQDHRVEIGKGTVINGNPSFVLFHPNNKIIIGKFCSIAPNVTILAGGNHPTNFITTFPLKLYFDIEEFAGWTNDCGDGDAITQIGNDVWIGQNVHIVSNAVIGDGAIIGACSVVRGEIPPYAVVIGNPAKVIRYRFDNVTISKLLALKWWDWPLDEIKKSAGEIASDDIEGFLERHAPSDDTDLRIGGRGAEKSRWWHRWLGKF